MRLMLMYLQPSSVAKDMSESKMKPKLCANELMILPIEMAFK